MIGSHRLRPAFIVLVAILLVSASLLVGLKKEIILSVDGQSHRLSTYLFKVGNLLHSQDISISPNDRLSPPVETWLKNGMTVTLQRAVPVQILTDGKITSFYSPDRSPSALLKQAGMNADPDDLILSDGKPVDLNEPFLASISTISLQVIRSVSFTFTVDGQAHVLTSTASTLGSALWDAGYELFTSDELDPPAQTPLTPGLSARLTRSRQVTIKTQQGNLIIRTAAQTVGEALEDASLPVQGLDYSQPSPSAPIPRNGMIQLVRVTEDVLVEQTPLPFETQYQPVDDLEIDSQSIVQAGEYGLTAQRVRLRYEDGQEVSRQVEDEWTARQPVPRIIGYGTLVSMKTEVVDGIQVQYWRMLNMYATSYHPSEVGDTTASGLPLKKGVAAVDTNYIPFYTQMYIPGYGEAVAADIGGGVIGRWIDLGYSDDDYVPWHQWVTVYFLWPPPANIVWIVP